MADVNIQQSPRSGGTGVILTILVVAALLVVAWFVFGGGWSHTRRTDVNVDINTPAASNGGGGGGNASGGSAPAAKNP